MGLIQLFTATSPLEPHFSCFGAPYFYVPWLSKSYDALLIYEPFQEPWQ